MQHSGLILKRLFAGAAAVLLLFGVEACGRSSRTDTSSTDAADRPRDVRVDLSIVVEDADGSTRSATAHCIGRVTGTGYLAPPEAAGSACRTAHISEPVSDFLAKRGRHRVPRHLCDVSIQLARDLPEVPPGRVTISGFYDGDRISRRVDAVNGGPCERARWKLMQPLITPGDEPLLRTYPPDLEY